jgi:hypothetical protein
MFATTLELQRVEEKLWRGLSAMNAATDLLATGQKTCVDLEQVGLLFGVLHDYLDGALQSLEDLRLKPEA